ncbi:50S ribosomal protein L25/general stress protein Ctc [Pelagibacteraceae bacterium]|jgi:large subunit ribosomal protein L25|nr:50S ribosomal protein L25/general stress protein Ctc [Pelagibacteraceae bacterium]|tara:strand:+ start:10621 stop:11373 length:753 start_codon:yes stop_codon:yes gene_type:complete
MNNLKAIKRESTTTGQVKKLRAEGFIPAILYGGTNPNAKISISKKLITNILNNDSFLSTVLELDIDGKKEKVLPREVAYHVVSDEPIHVDFMRIVAGAKIIIEIPVQFKNNEDCPGLKRGGVLNIVRRKVELKCPADKIPKDIIIDLAGLEIGTSIKISSVKLPENVSPTILDRDFVIATVAAPTIVKEPEKPTAESGETEVGASGETAAAAGEETGAAKEGDAAKKDDKGKDQAAEKKPAAEKKTTEKK